MVKSLLINESFCNRLIGIDSPVAHERPVHAHTVVRLRSISIEYRYKKQKILQKVGINAKKISDY